MIMLPASIISARLRGRAAVGTRARRRFAPFITSLVVVFAPVRLALTGIYWVEMKQCVYFTPTIDIMPSFWPTELLAIGLSTENKKGATFKSVVFVYDVRLVTTNTQAT